MAEIKSYLLSSITYITQKYEEPGTPKGRPFFYHTALAEYKKKASFEITLHSLFEITTQGGFIFKYLLHYLTIIFSE